MEIVICPDPDTVARTAAETVAQVPRRVSPSVVLGVATGSFALDEYVGLPQGHPESYVEVIRRTVAKPLRLAPERVHLPDGFAEDIEEACADYELAIAAAGGVDIQILGIGSNSHIGFNEPSSLASRTRIKMLTPRTREDNARFVDSLDDVPLHCLTPGLGTIMDADEAAAPKLTLTDYYRWAYDHKPAWQGFGQD